MARLSILLLGHRGLGDLFSFGIHDNFRGIAIALVAGSASKTLHRGRAAVDRGHGDPAVSAFKTGTYAELARIGVRS